MNKSSSKIQKTPSKIDTGRVIYTGELIEFFPKDKQGYIIPDNEDLNVNVVLLSDVEFNKLGVKSLHPEQRLAYEVIWKNSLPHAINLSMIPGKSKVRREKKI